MSSDRSNPSSSSLPRASPSASPSASPYHAKRISGAHGSQEIRGLPSPPPSGSSSSPLAGLENSHDPWFDTFDIAPSSYRGVKGNQVAPEARGDQAIHGYRLHTPQRSIRMGDAPGLESSWRILPSESEAARMPWDESRGVGLRGASHLIQPVNPVGEGSVSAAELFSAPARATRRDVSRDRKEKRPMPTEVWADLVDTSKGRDKVLKCVQYSLRTYLYLLSLIAAVRPLAPWFRSNEKRMRLAVSGLSLTRKCLILFNPLHPLTTLLSPTPMSASTMLSHLLDFLSATADDLYCLNRLGIVNKRIGKKADEWSNRLWLLSTLIGLYKLHLKTIPNLRHKFQSLPTVKSGSTSQLCSAGGDETAKLQKEMSDSKWTNRKLLADLIFSSYDVFDLKWFSEPIHCATGLAAAFIATSKLFDKQWISAMGK